MDQQIRTGKSMNVLGVIFDSKLDWHEQVTNTIKKANKSLYAIKMIRNYFTPKEIKIFLDSFFYSVLYYYSEIWLLPTLNQCQKQLLLSASANALRLCYRHPTPFVSFDLLHKQNFKSTPKYYAKYQLSLLLYKYFNSTSHNKDWIDFANQFVITGRQSKFIMMQNNKLRIGLNSVPNRFNYISNQIELDMLNLSFPPLSSK
jgi:hypothetical protein